MAMWSLRIGRVTCSKLRMKKPKLSFSLAVKKQVHPTVKTEETKFLEGLFLAVSQMAVSISKFFLM